MRRHCRCADRDSMKDSFGRNIDYMRISVTDRCDLRCRYCMPEEGIKKVDKSMILGSDEILRICSVAISLGINKFKITGGEPFVRCDLIKLLREMKALPGIDELTITTNGQLLKNYIDELSDMGIDGINISLDTLRPDRYRYITRVGDLEKTLRGIDLSVDSGIKTKLNCLIQKRFNDDEVAELTEFAMNKGIDIRFIEMMPIGIADADSGVSSEETLHCIKDLYPEIREDSSRHGNGPATYYKVPGRDGGIGIISAMHGRFCENCNRIRLTSMGFIKPCLCYEDGVFIRPYLEKSDEELRQAFIEIIKFKPARHCFENVRVADPHSMVQIGG